MSAHLQILRRTVPDVDCLEVGIVAVVKCSAVAVELIGELGSD